MNHPVILLLFIISMVGIFPSYAEEIAGEKAWFGVATHVHQGDGGRATSVYVDLVWPDSPAEKAGLKEGDRITFFGGEELTSTSHLAKIMKRAKPGTPVEIRWLRGKKELQAKAALTEYSDEEFEKIEFLEAEKWRDGRRERYIKPEEISESAATEIWLDLEDKIDRMLLRRGFSPEHCDRILAAIAVGEKELREPAPPGEGAEKGEATGPE